MMENISYEENFERVKVDNAFYIGVPQGYDYSHNTDQSLICYELGRPHHFVMYKGKRNALIPDILFESQECFSVNQKISHAMFKDCRDSFSMVGGLPSIILKNTKNLSVRYTSPTIGKDFSNCAYCVIVPGTLYVGCFRINRVLTTSQMEEMVKSVLGTISEQASATDEQVAHSTSKTQDDQNQGTNSSNNKGCIVELEDGWSIAVPEGFSYNNDISKNGESQCSPHGRYDLVIAQPKSNDFVNFADPYSNRIAFVTLDQIDFITAQKYYDFKGTPEEWVTVKRTPDLTVKYTLFSFRSTVSTYQVIVEGEKSCRRCQILINARMKKEERAAFVEQMLSTIEPLSKSNDVKNHADEAETQRRQQEEEERRKREYEERCRREAEERARKSAEEAERRRKAEAEEAERRRKAAEEAERKRQAELAAKRAHYDELQKNISEQEWIIAANRGWFGEQAKARKAAKEQLAILQAQLAREFPNGRP